jgi:hypothetical protein
MKEGSTKASQQANASSARTRPAGISHLDDSPNRPVHRTVGVYERPAARRATPALIAVVVLVILSAIYFARLIF